MHYDCKHYDSACKASLTGRFLPGHSRIRTTHLKYQSLVTFFKGLVSDFLYCYICTITTGFYTRNTLYYERHMRVFCRLVVFFLRKEMEKRCFFFDIVIQAFRGLLLLPMLLLPTAAAATSCHYDGWCNWHLVAQSEAPRSSFCLQRGSNREEAWTIQIHVAAVGVSQTWNTILRGCWPQ